MAETLTTAERLQAFGPKRAMVDNDIVETHSISDLIRAEEHDARCVPAGEKFGSKMRLTRVRYRGPVDGCG